MTKEEFLDSLETQASVMVPPEEYRRLKEAEQELLRLQKEAGND